MRPSTTWIASLIFLAAQPVAAVGELGFALGVKRNSDGQCKTTADYEADFDHLAGLTDTIRVYAASDCNTLQQLAPALVAKNFKLYLGIWPNDEQHFEAEKQAVSQYLPTIPQSVIRGFTVGSEALYRKDMTPQELADKINAFRQHVSTVKDSNGNSYAGKPVGTAESWNVLVDGWSHPAIVAADTVFANAFSYWQGQVMANASYSFTDDIMQALQMIQSVKGTDDFDFWVGETGWPTGGANYGAAVPSVENAARFYQEGICALRGWGVNTFIFEAFDETWKPDTEGDNGQSVSGVERYWGVFDSQNKAKYDLTCKFN